MSLPEKFYKLRVSMEIQQWEKDEYGGERWSGGNNGLRVEESIDLGALDFMQMCGVLGKMHEALKEIGEKKDKKRNCSLRPECAPDTKCVHVPECE